MYKINFFITCLFSVGFALAQNSTFSGQWILTAIENKGELKQQESIFNFTENGVIYIDELEFGTWEINPSKKIVDFKSAISGDNFNGAYTILKLSKEVMILSNDIATYHFKGIDLQKIEEYNKKSNLVGTWKLNHDVFDDIWLQLQLPNKVRIISYSNGTTSTEKGKWIYNPKTNEIDITTPFLHILKGKSRIKDLTNNFLALVASRETLFFDNVNTTHIEWLDFTVKDFKKLNDEESKLPKQWKNDQKLIRHLNKIESLVYKYGTYITAAGDLSYAKILKKVDTNIHKQSVSFSNILMSRYDTLQISESHKGSLMNKNNYFFPEESPDYFKVIGNELLEGYQCTVIEAILGDKKIKYWMIDNQPGVYAQIITQEKNDFFKQTTYTILTLKRSY